MKTKRSQEAYVMIDHRNSPGITAEFVRKNKLDVPVVGAGKIFESAMNVCGHCGGNVILNPDRSRPREWCFTCDKYICDNCGAAKKAGASCVPVQKKLADAYEKIIRNLQEGAI